MSHRGLEGCACLCFFCSPRMYESDLRLGRALLAQQWWGQENSVQNGDSEAGRFYPHSTLLVEDWNRRCVGEEGSWMLPRSCRINAKKTPQLCGCDQRWGQGDFWEEHVWGNRINRTKGAGHVATGCWCVFLSDVVCPVFSINSTSHPPPCAWRSKCQQLEWELGSQGLHVCTGSRLEEWKAKCQQLQSEVVCQRVSIMASCSQQDNRPGSQLSKQS